MRFCVMPMSAVGDEEVITLEHIGTSENRILFNMRSSRMARPPCGFCLSGVIITARPVLQNGGL